MAGLRTTSYGRPAVAVAVLVAISPFLFGLPRGTGLPLLRPSEGLQLVVTGSVLAAAACALARGGRWRVRPTSVDRWLLAMTAAASIVPLLWLAARGRPIGAAEAMAVFPFLKYGALYLLVRASVRTVDEVRLVVAAALAAASGVAAIAVTQALGVPPVVGFLERFFVSSTEDVVDGGRATTTIGSSIATGAFLSLAAGIALAMAFATGRRRWYPLVGVLGIGALASGQAGSVLGLLMMVAVVAGLAGRLRQVAMWAAPAGLLAVVGLWPIVAARLADLDPDSGLPHSWLVRWNNLTELYWPALADGGWLLGVTPDATVVPPDVWREIVYLESGYLWLLWVGGVPLLVAAVGFLAAAWRRPMTTPVDDVEGSGDGPLPIEVGLFVAGRAAVAMVALLTVVDPHLTLRAGADLFYVILALGMAGRPLLVAEPFPARRWRELLAVDSLPARLLPARLHLAEGAAPEPVAARPGPAPEAVLDLAVVADGARLAGASLALHRAGSALHGDLTVAGTTSRTPRAGPGSPERALLIRAAVLCADSLRLASLRLPGDEPVHRAELKRASALVDTSEIERLRRELSNGIDGAGSRRAPGPGDRRASVGSDPDLAATVDRPAVRLVTDHRPPRWKRVVDLAVLAAAAVPVAPIALACCTLVARSGPGPVLFRQVRIGTGGLPFQIYKFRTMHVGNDDRAVREQNRRELLEGAEAGKDELDHRITPVGRRLRRLSLDELPQLVNVARGEMSLVGPRPSLLWETELFEPSRRRRLTIRPGLTGPWQVGGRADVSMAEMLEMDLGYVERMSLREDLRCLAGTASSVLAAKGAR